MLSVSNSLPVSNYATSVVSLASGSVFKPKTNSKIRIDLPANLGMVDFHSSYLQFKMRVVPPTLSQDGTAGNRRDVYNMELSNEQGAEQIIRDLRVLVDNKPVEEIQHYNILHKFKKDFEDDNSKSGLDSTFNHAELQPAVALTNGYFNTDYNASTPAVSYDQVGQKQIVKMGCSGVLSLPVGFPVLATGKVGIEITLEDAERVLKPKGDFENIACENANGTGQTTAGGAIASVDVSLTNDGTLEGLGFTNREDTPFAIGNTIRIRCDVAGGNNINVLRLITGVANQGGNTIRLTFANIAGGANNANVSNIVIGALVGVDENGARRASQYDYEITEVEYVVRSIDMPPPYLQSLQRRIQQDAFMMDIPTYSSYLDNIQAGLRQQSINIPCFSSRVKSVLSIPVNAIETNYRPNRNGSIDNLREYQAQIGTRREPNRPVDLTNTTNAPAFYPSQEYLYELKKVFKSSGVGVRTLKGFRNNFAFPRSLSAMGGSEDLSDKGFRFNVEYNADPLAHNVYTFVYHTKRLQVSPQGLVVFS
jgi:hypothetical protein